MSNNESENLNILLETAELKQESVLSNIRSLDIKASIILAFFGVLLIPSIEIFQWTLINDDLVCLKIVPGASVAIGVFFCLLTLFPQKSVSFPKLSILKDIYHEGAYSDQLRAELFSYLKEKLMSEENEHKPAERPAPPPQNEPNKPTVIIPPKTRPKLIDIQTEGLRPDIEEKKKNNSEKQQKKISNFSELRESIRFT
jgi:hypothetical protein